MKFSQLNALRSDFLKLGVLVSKSEFNRQLDLKIAIYDHEYTFSDNIKSFADILQLKYHSQKDKIIISPSILISLSPEKFSEIKEKVHEINMELEKFFTALDEHPGLILERRIDVLEVSLTDISTYEEPWKAKS